MRQREEPEQRRLAARPGIQHAPGLQEAEAEACRGRRAARRGRAHGRAGPAPPRPGRRPAAHPRRRGTPRAAAARFAAPQPGQGRRRPVGIVLLQHRQVEQPFAGIVEQFQRDAPARRAAPPSEPVPVQVQGQLQGREILGPLRPGGGSAASAARCAADVEARQPLRPRGHQPHAAQPAAGGRLERRQRAPPAPGGQQVRDQRGEEDGLAGARQAR